MNKATLKSRATLIGKVFADKGVTLTRAEQLNLVAQLEGARDWHHASGEMVSRTAPKAFDPLQLAAARAYASGDFAYMTDDCEIADCGDTLFTFVIREVGEADGARDEAVRMMRSAARELEEVADYLESQETTVEKLSEPAFPYGHRATNSRGYPAGWSLKFISDRFCELQEGLQTSYPDLAKWAQDNPTEVQRLSDACHEELAFLVELNGEKGVLYEIEIETSESEGDNPDGTPRCGVLEAVRRLQLQNAVGKLEKKHPHLTWAIGEPGSGGNGRLAVWAFSPASSLVNEDEIKALTKDLYDEFY